MHQRQGFIHSDFSNHVCRPKKSLYGLCQAPRAWFSQLIEKLQDYGFQGSKAYISLYILHRGHHHFIILIYVDDIIVTRSDPKDINHLITHLSSDYPIKHLDCLSYFLGVETIRDGSDLILIQQKYIADLLHKVKLDKVKRIATPISTTCHLSKFDDCEFDDPQLYRNTLGAHYLGFTWPDITFNVHRVSKFMHQPKLPHW